MNDQVALDDIYIEDPLDIAFVEDDNIATALESISTIYHGLILTPYAAYSDPRIQSALRTRIDELAAVTSISTEAIHQSIDKLSQRTYSTENAFFDAVKEIIAKIIEWLGNVRDFIIRVIKSIINVRNRNSQANKKTASDFRENKQAYQKTKQEPPKILKTTVPGQCYLAFHTPKHKPKAGFVYNTAGLKRAIDEVHQGMDGFIGKLSDEADNILSAVSALLSQLNANKTYKAEDVLRKINQSKILSGLYHNHFEMLGFGVIQKPARNATKYIRNKYGLTNVVDCYGWGEVEGFEVAVETSEFESIVSSFTDKSDEMIGKIVALNSRLADSRAIKQLAALRSDTKRTIALMEAGNPDPSSTIVARKELLAKLELVYELVSQLTDTCLLVARFYTRYTLMQGKILSLAGDSIKQYY